MSRNVFMKCMCVAMSFALLFSVMLLKDDNKAYAVKEQFEKTTDENYDDPNAKNFLMYAEDIVTVTGKGVVLSGTVRRGRLKAGDKLQVTNIENGKIVRYDMTVQQIEMYRRVLDEAKTGDSIGIVVGWPFGETEKAGKLVRGAVVQGATSPLPAVKSVTGVFTPAATGFTDTITAGFKAQLNVGGCTYNCSVLDVNGTAIAAGQSERYGVKIGEFDGGLIVYPGLEIQIQKEGRTYGTFVVVSSETIVEEKTETTTAAETVKKPNTISVSAKKKSVKFKKLKKKKQIVSKAVLVKSAIGNVTFEKVKKGSSSKLSINKKTGKITVKKKTKKGSYKIVVKVSAAGNNQYLAASKTVTVTIKVK